MNLLYRLNYSIKLNKSLTRIGLLPLVNLKKSYLQEKLFVVVVVRTMLFNMRQKQLHQVEL